MENKEEYHDPDYPEALASVPETPTVSEDDKMEKIKLIIRREFKKELSAREEEVRLIDQRQLTARRHLHQVRYSLVDSLYNNQKLQLTNSQIEDDVATQTEPRARAEVSSMLRDTQRQLHPSVRKLLGKKSVGIEEILRSKEPRNKTRKNYSAMVKRNYTISDDATTSLRPVKEEDLIEKPIDLEAGSSKPKKIPRRFKPKVNNVVTLAEVTRNKKKHRFRIIIGNTSKYAPPASRADKSTHKWLLYVRAPPPRDVSLAVSAVTVQLHHSYAPHHTVYLHKPPFQVSRRGWGEFPARVTLHFALPDVNRPATITHTIKLDRHYTGLQTLGAETLADVWLYSTPDMLQCEYKPDDEEYYTLEKPIQENKELNEELINNIKTEQHIEEDGLSNVKIDQTVGAVDLINVKIEQRDEIEEENFRNGENDSWLDFFAKDTSEVNVDEMLIKNIKNEPDYEEPIEKDALTEQDEKVQPECKETNRIVKYIEPNTGKIYYLKMDINLDLSTVKEVIIQQEPKQQKNGVKTKKVQSLQKPTRHVTDRQTNLSHIENDHCYLKHIPKVVKNTLLQDLKSIVSRFKCPRMVVNFLLKRIPLISEHACSPDFEQTLPFVVENDEKFWKLDFAKRRNIEWSRAKLINKILSEQFKNTNHIWSTKQILIFSRLHGYHPLRPETTQPMQTDLDEWSSWTMETRKVESKIREIYPKASDISSLTIFKDDFSKIGEVFDLTDSDEELDIVRDSPVKVERKVLPDCVDRLPMLPVSQEDKLKFFFIERKCLDIGIELRNEDVGEGYSYSAVHAVLLSAMKSFAEELIRSALADQLSHANDSQLPTIWTGSSSRCMLRVEHVYGAARGEGSARLRALSRAHLATHDKHPHTI